MVMAHFIVPGRQRSDGQGLLILPGVSLSLSCFFPLQMVNDGLLEGLCGRRHRLRGSTVMFPNAN